MVAMRDVHLRGRLVPVRVVIDFFTQRVKTVDLMHETEAGYIGIIAKAPFWVDLDRFGWIFMHATNVGGGYRPDVMVKKSPGGVNRWGRIPPVDGCAVEKSAVEGYGLAVEIDGIQKRRYSLLLVAGGTEGFSS